MQFYNDTLIISAPIRKLYFVVQSKLIENKQAFQGENWDNIQEGIILGRRNIRTATYHLRDKGIRMNRFREFYRAISLIMKYVTPQWVRTRWAYSEKQTSDSFIDPHDFHNFCLYKLEKCLQLSWWVSGFRFNGDGFTGYELVNGLSRWKEILYHQD